MTTPKIQEWFETLTSGPALALADLPASTGDTAGVFTIWYRGQLLHRGYAISTAETKPSNFAQADGVRGRMRGLTRQPGRPLQQRLAQHFPEDWAATFGTDQARARELLRAHGRYRVVRFETGHEARAVLGQLADALDSFVQ
jgi:hypothetical protein